MRRGIATVSAAVAGLALITPGAARADVPHSVPSSAALSAASSTA